MKKQNTLFIDQLEQRALFAADAGMVEVEHVVADVAEHSAAEATSQHEEPSAFAKFMGSLIKGLFQAIVASAAADLADNDPFASAAIAYVATGDTATAATAAAMASMKS